MKKRAIVSLANERGNYYQGLARLANSLKGNFDGDFIGIMGEHTVGALPHLEHNYAFKVFAIDHAIKLGYSQILWLDSSVYAIKNIDHLFDIIENDGYLMQDAGCYVGEWTNDKTLETLSISRDISMHMKCYGNAGLLGLNMEHIKAARFFALWKYHLNLFNGAWDNKNNTESLDPRCKGHRHDMSVGSIIANKLGMFYQPGNEILQYAAPDDMPINDTICLFAQGI